LRKQLSAAAFKEFGSRGGVAGNSSEVNGQNGRRKEPR